MYGLRLQSVTLFPVLFPLFFSILDIPQILAADIIPKIEDMQLFTTAHHEGTPANDAVGVWCWFDIVILANADATEPLVKDGRALVWRSHDIPITATQVADEQAGKLFGRDHEILGLLNVGPCFFLLLVRV